MRRKSERTANKKANVSPEKKIEKIKRTRTRRRKQSSSSENEAAVEVIPPQERVAVVEVEKAPAQTAPPVAQEGNVDESQEQVWQVKSSEASGDGGEIHKLKICLTRPPSTPERAERSPRSRRKHSRATSSSDGTPSVEALEDKKKKHRTKRRNRESKDEVEGNHDSPGDEPETDVKDKDLEPNKNKITQSIEVLPPTSSDETPVSTTNEEIKMDTTETMEIQDISQSEEIHVVIEIQDKTSDADTTVASPKSEMETQKDETEIVQSETCPEKDMTKKDSDKDKDSTKKDSEQKGCESSEKTEVLEIHTAEKKCESLDAEMSAAEMEREEQKEESASTTQGTEGTSPECEVSNKEAKTKKVSETVESSQDEGIKDDIETHVVESSGSVEQGTSRTMSTESNNETSVDDSKSGHEREFETSKSTQLTQEDNIQNGEPAPIVVNRKRKWGSRSVKLQKSITISTDVLKDIIPDVKPIKFEEVMEEKDKKHKRIDLVEKIERKVERPVLPKIVIDNTENIEHSKIEDGEIQDVPKPKEPRLASSRKISIVKDNDSIITKPPSPPRHKQSCILFITNLVRPFTLTQLKNLLQRTGKIVEEGFWIDKIKSKCFVKYEKEDQAVETRHALHGVTWPVSNPKTLQVDFSNQEAFDKAKANEDIDNAMVDPKYEVLEACLRQEELMRERGELEKLWERKTMVREWDMGKDGKDHIKDKDNKDKLMRRGERLPDKRRHKSPERSPEPAKKFKIKEEEAPAKLLDDLFRKTKTTPCIYWLPLSAETIAVKEEQRRQHMAEHERRLQELRRTHRRH